MKPAPAEGVWPARRVAGWGLFVLSLANILSYLDRIVINLLVQPIQREFALSDTQFSLLQGLAFGMFYIALAVPIGRLVDTRSRKWIIAASVFAFSLSSLVSGLARGFGQFFLARVGVGAGEAGVVPAAYSLISDYFPPERLGRAISIFTMTAFIGIGLAYVGGGAAIAAIAAWDAPGALGALAPWRRVFLLVSLPGFIVVLLLVLMDEPGRHGRASMDAVPYRAMIAHVAGRRRTLLPLFAGFAWITMSSYATTAWTPAMLIRTYGWSATDVGLRYGTLFLVFGPAGALVAGHLCDRMTVGGVRDAPLRIAAWAAMAAGVCGGLAPLMPDSRLAMLLLGPSIFLSTMAFPMAGTAVQLITPNQLRGQITALYMLVINLIGLGVGPLVVGLFSDFLFPNVDGIRYSLAILTLTAAPAAFICLALARPSYCALRASA